MTGLLCLHIVQFWLRFHSTYKTFLEIYLNLSGSICARAMFTLFVLEMFTVQPKQFDVIVVTAVSLYTMFQ